MTEQSTLINMPGFAELAQSLAALISETGSQEWHEFSARIRVTDGTVLVDGERLAPIT